MVLSNCDTILEWLKDQAINKEIIDPLLYLQAAEKLNAMVGDETDKLIDLDFLLAQQRHVLVEQYTVAKAKVLVEANPLFRERQKQKAKIDRIQEAIRLAKTHSRLKSDELRSGL